MSQCMLICSRKFESDHTVLVLRPFHKDRAVLNHGHPVGWDASKKRRC